MIATHLTNLSVHRPCTSSTPTPGLLNRPLRRTMISRLTVRRSLQLSQRVGAAQRSFAASVRLHDTTKPIAAKAETTPETKSEEDSLGLVENEERGLKQAPNRKEIWSRSQKPRAAAMSGPRFEQTDFDLQPQSRAAIELIHRQPVRWTHDRVVACDGGGGPAGHPRIFINTDKPEIATCNYCGLPFANEHHREHLESLPQTSYPLA
ncbi:zinc-finger domain-containing protein [Durotheca rogersii]|uniref:zinc-finger domain-containing protein n=1 Tax=Durotheca rogersii TaxID=419775 RepID=UPI002220EE31|nr:zinc-finger domain-containing protein [Durotheca rogersii]KAI5864462.1 zinc-finger domain-containing protein [Durotheca rogersii]